MRALPFGGSAPPPAGFKFRVLMNQYNETLQFKFVDDGVPNRGLVRPGNGGVADQKVATVDYQQAIEQIVAEDMPPSGLAGPADLPIHHEPGLFLYEKNLLAKTDVFDGKNAKVVDLDIARLASIPHGNSVLGLGKHRVCDGMPTIPKLSGLPSGRFEDVTTPDYDFRDSSAPDPYLAPYKHYIDHPFMGNVAGVAGFPGFSPADMNAILRFANEDVNIVKTTVFTFDTTIRSGGITSVPFTKREADPVSMKSTFWLQELAEKDRDGKPKLRMQYSQVVMLNFFAPREDEFPERASWPHISIATLEKEGDPKIVYAG